jgi:hypothetical protein
MPKNPKFNNRSLIYDPTQGIAHQINGLNKLEVKKLLDIPYSIQFDSALEFKTYCQLIELFPRTSIHIHSQLFSKPFLPFTVIPDFIVTDIENDSDIKAIFEVKGYCNESYPYKIFSFLMSNPEYLPKYHIITTNPNRLLRRKIFKFLAQKGVAIIALEDLSKFF